MDRLEVINNELERISREIVGLTAGATGKNGGYALDAPFVQALETRRQELLDVVLNQDEEWN